MEGKLVPTPPPEPLDDRIGPWVAATLQRSLAYAMTLVRNRTEAEDIVHDCYSRLLAGADRYDLPRDGTKLLFKAITNACINRSRRRPPVVSLDAVGGSAGPARLAPADRREASPEHRAILGELEAAVAEALEELPVTQRAIVEPRSLGHSPVEVAEMLGLSRANTRVLLHRARRALADRLRPFIEDHEL